MESEVFAETWHAAVDRAHYDFYEPDTDGYRWAGNFAGDGNQIGVCGLVGEHAVSVETWAGDRRLDDRIIRQLSIHKVRRGHRPPVSAEEEQADETMIEDDERLLMIGTTSHPCPGVRVVGERLWAGTTLIDDVRLRVITASPARDFAVRVCIDPDTLTRTPPARRR